jgi:hypothetical protein
MTAFTVWKFDTPDGAESAASRVKTVAGEGLIKILDHAVVAWPVGARRPTTMHGHDSVRHGGGWGALWGLLLAPCSLCPWSVLPLGLLSEGWRKQPKGWGSARNSWRRFAHRSGHLSFLVAEEGTWIGWASDSTVRT